MRPWECWYHSTAHMYGSWLRGDPRGWRARHHREHVDGDYKNPPPLGKYQELFEQSTALMTREPVKLERGLRQFVVDMVVERILSRGSEVAIASLDGIHLHILHQSFKRNPKIELGIAKQYATAQLKAHGFAVGLDLKIGEGIWARGSHPKPIADNRHFHKTFDYIKDHSKRGAATWEPAPFPEFPDLNLLL